MFDSILKTASRFFRQFGSLITVLVLWEILVRLDILDYRFFPAPTTVMATLYKLTISGEIILHTLVSMQRVLFGFSIGAVLGLVVGLAMGWSRTAEQILDPLIAVFYPIPKVALLPLILIIFGIGESSKIAIVAIAVFFTVVINTAAGVKAIDPVFLDAAQNYGARGWRMFVKVVIPASLPHIFTGMRLALGFGLVVIIAAEFVASNNKGLGYMIWLAWSTLTTNTMYAGLIVIGMIGLITTATLQGLSWLLMPWTRKGEKSIPQWLAKTNWSEHYLINLTRRIPQALLTWSRLYFYILPRGADILLPEPTDEAIRFEWVDEGNVSEIQPWKNGRLVNQFKRNLNRGMLGLYAFHEGRVVGYLWAAIRTGRFTLGTTHYPIEIGDAYIKGAEVDPEFRRRGIASALRYTLVHHLRDLSQAVELHRICGTVLVQNTPMIKLLERQGSIRYQEIFQVRLTPYVFIRRIWEIDKKTYQTLPGSGRWSVKFKIPKFLFDPWIQRLPGVVWAKSKRVWHPRGEA